VNSRWTGAARRRLVVIAVAVVALCGLAGVSAQAGPGVPTALTGSDRMPNGWGLHPAGTQVLTSRAPTGVSVGPDGSVYAVTSGIFEEAVVHVDPTTLLPTSDAVASAFQGVAADPNGNVWVSGGPANVVFQYKGAGPALVDVRQVPLVPDAPNNGVPANSYPGTMLQHGSRLFVSGSLSMPKASVPGGACPGGSPICSVVNVLDVGTGDPTATPVKHSIPVGRDAYGLAFAPATSTLYVANWADQTNPARANGAGTVSVVKVNPDGSGQEIAAVPVGSSPAGLSLSGDGRLLAVADSGSDQISVLAVDAATGSLTPTQTLSVSPTAGAPLGVDPLAVSFSNNSKLLYASLPGLNAAEVFEVSGGRVSAIPETVTATFAGSTVKSLRVPATYIPTGWYPDALAVGPEPGSQPGSRLYVANLKGQGAGPGHYDQLEPLVGSATEGTLSAIDVPPEGTAQSRAFNAWTAQAVTNDELAPLWDSHLEDPAADPCVAPAGDAVGVSGLLCHQHGAPTDPHGLHVVVIEAENKTFDSYFGDTGAQLHNANASPLFTQYGAAVTTNQHQLANQFTLSDNFWNEGAESSVVGHSWLSGGIATPDNELTWGQSYDQGIRGNRPGGEYGAPSLSSGSVSSASLSGPADPQVAAQESQLLNTPQVMADEVLGAGLSARVYGTDVSPGDRVQQQGDQAPMSLWGESGSGVSSDLAWPDVDRASMFLHGSTVSHAWDLLDGPPTPNFGKTISMSPADRSKFSLDSWTSAYQSCTSAGGAVASCQSSMPNYVYMELPENHTYDVSNVLNPLDPTPQSMVADNDYAIGQIIQGLSKSPFWKNTIVFLTEDDNQFTGDHVDIHRTFLLTMGGMARQLGAQGRVATQASSFPSVLKTTEALFGLRPLTFFDWRAAPLQDVVANTTGANHAAYTPVCPPTPFLAASPTSAAGPCTPSVPGAP
jgi:DNA-binding beta-propeller fold protein YncE